MSDIEKAVHKQKEKKRWKRRRLLVSHENSIQQMDVVQKNHGEHRIAPHLDVRRDGIQSMDARTHDESV